MKNVKKLVKEILDIQRDAGVNIQILDSNTATFLLLGYCSSNNLTDEVSLDFILNSTDIKTAIKEALISIGEKEKDLKEAIEYLLNNLDLSNDEIAKIIVILKSSFFSDEDYRVSFEYMIENITELIGKNSGENVTPNFINKLAVEILSPKGEEFYDGTFGLGGDALEAYRFSAKHENEIKIYGQELDNKIYSIAKVRMFINEVRFSDIRLGDVLINPLFTDGENKVKKFDNIIMNPPFGVGWKEKKAGIINDKYGRFIYGIPGISSADWLFISTVLKSLKEKGKAVVITTLGTLFRGGVEEHLRDKIIGFDYIESVIELPGGLFTNTFIPCAMIVFNMNKSEELKNKIKFINVDSIYTYLRRGKNILSQEDINSILDIYRNKEDIEDVSKIVELKEIRNGNILPSRYVVKTEFETDEFGKVKINLEKLENTKVLGEIADFYRGINVTSKNIQDSKGNYKIINLADIKNGEVDIASLPTYKIENNARVEAYKVETGDIIISNRGTTKVCIIPPHTENVLISQNFIGLRLKHGNDPQYIKEFLQSPIGMFLIESKKTGTATAIINQKDLKELPIVDMDENQQKKIINVYKEKEEKIKKEIEKLQLNLEKIKLDLYGKMNIKDTFEIM